MRKSKFMMSSWLAVVATVLVSVMATAEAAGSGANAANGQTIFTQGKGDAAACVSCHGENAEGNDAMGAPRLATIGYGYIVKQLTNFAEDKRTPSEDSIGAAMNGFAKALSPQDRRDVSAYVNSLKTTPVLSDLKALKEEGHKVGEVYKGAKIVRFGTSKVSACKSCHGFNGRGNDPMFPKIGQQKYVYLVNQLNNWRDGSRANDPSAIMRNIAKKLSDEDIVNVAAYLSAASPVKGVGDVAPNNDTLLHAVNH